jgi:hypothetical protein
MAGRPSLHLRSTPFACRNARWSFNFLALEHDQLPFRSNLIEAQNIEISVAAPDLKIAVVLAMPLIEVIHDLDLPSIQAEAAEHFDTAMAGIGLNRNPHG